MYVGISSISNRYGTGPSYAYGYGPGTGRLFVGRSLVLGSGPAMPMENTNCKYPGEIAYGYASSYSDVPNNPQQPVYRVLQCEQLGSNQFGNVEDLWRPISQRSPVMTTEFTANVSANNPYSGYIPGPTYQDGFYYGQTVGLWQSCSLDDMQSGTLNLYYGQKGHVDYATLNKYYTKVYPESAEIIYGHTFYTWKVETNNPNTEILCQNWNNPYEGGGFTQYIEVSTNPNYQSLN